MIKLLAELPRPRLAIRHTQQDVAWQRGRKAAIVVLRALAIRCVVAVRWRAGGVGVSAQIRPIGHGGNQQRQH